MARSKQGSVVERKRKNGKKQLYARIRWTERIGGKTVQREKFARVRTRTEGTIGCKGAISASIEALDTRGQAVALANATGFDWC